MSEHPLVLLVGHCSADSRRLTAVVRAASGGAVVESIGDQRRLEARLSAATLVLVNRVLDGAFTATGLGLVASVAKHGTPVMLISNLPDAQREAQRLGATTGFGKSALDDDQTLARLAAALAPA